MSEKLRPQVTVVKRCEFRGPNGQCNSVNRTIPDGAKPLSPFWMCQQPLTNKDKPINCDQAHLIEYFKK